MAIIRKNIDVSAPLTDEQIGMLKEAEKSEYVYDKDNTLLQKKSLHNSSGYQMR